MDSPSPGSRPGDDGTIDGNMQPARCQLAAALTATAIAVAGCGFSQTSPDLFVLQRSGPGGTLTMLLNDGGTIRCNGGPAKPISDATLIQARDLADNLDKDAKAKLHLPGRTDSVYRYRIRLPDGTITFADTAAASHHELSQAELFAAQAADGACRAG
jgi:hypothetical protein